MTGTPQLEVIDLDGLKWDIGAPMPVLLAGRQDAVVLCYEGSTSGAEELSVMEIRFEMYTSVRMGHPNDEVIEGHPLWACGMEPYEAHKVHNSPLLAEHRRINSVHPQHKDERWADKSHYFLAFHDEVVEALADRISARRLEGTMAAELARAAAGLD